MSYLKAGDFGCVVAEPEVGDARARQTFPVIRVNASVRDSVPTLAVRRSPSARILWCFAVLFECSVG